MKSRIDYFIVLAVVLFAVWGFQLSCTEKERARSFGGTTDVVLPAGQKLVTVTWKEASLWYLTRPMHEGEVPELYTFREDSPYGMQQGTVHLQEKR